MSVSYYSNVVLGVRLSDLNPVMSEKKLTKTKYDENTGSPYEFKYSEKRTVFNTENPVEVQGTLEGILSNLNNYGTLEGESDDFVDTCLSVYSNSYLSDIFRYSKADLTQILVGRHLADSSSWDEKKHVVEVPTDLDAHRALVIEELVEKFGYTGEVKLYNILTCSY